MSNSCNYSSSANNIQFQPFDYSSLDLSTRRFILQRTKNIQAIHTQTLQNAFLVGEILLEVKARLEYGQFCRWVRCEFQGSQSTAINHMHLATTFRFATVANLNVPLTALYEIARPTTPDTARAEIFQLAQDNQKITKVRAKKIIANHKKTLNALDESANSGFVPVTIDVPCDEVRDLPDNVIAFSRNGTDKEFRAKNQHINALDVLVLLLELHVSQIQYFLGLEFPQKIAD